MAKGRFETRAGSLPMMRRDFGDDGVGGHAESGKFEVEVEYLIWCWIIIRISSLLLIISDLVSD